MFVSGIKKSKFDSDLKEKYDIILKYERKEEIDMEEKRLILKLEEEKKKKKDEEEIILNSYILQ